MNIFDKIIADTKNQVTSAKIQLIEKEGVKVVCKTCKKEILVKSLDTTCPNCHETIQLVIED